jgi:hypothetical protein
LGGLNSVEVASFFWTREVIIGHGFSIIKTENVQFLCSDYSLLEQEDHPFKISKKLYPGGRNTCRGIIMGQTLKIL